jgi:hypothetical protein
VLARPFGSQNLAVSPALLPLIAAPSMPPHLVHAECPELAPEHDPGSKIRIISSISRSVLHDRPLPLDLTTVNCCQALAIPRRI